MPLDLVEADLGMARAQPAGVERRELDQPVLLILRQPVEGESARLSSARLIAAPTTSRARPGILREGRRFQRGKAGPRNRLDVIGLLIMASQRWLPVRVAKDSRQATQWSRRYFCEFLYN